MKKQPLIIFVSRCACLAYSFVFQDTCSSVFIALMFQDTWHFCVVGHICCIFHAKPIESSTQAKSTHTCCTWCKSQQHYISMRAKSTTQQKKKNPSLFPSLTCCHGKTIGSRPKFGFVRPLEANSRMAEGTGLWRLTKFNFPGHSRKLILSSGKTLESLLSMLALPEGEKSTCAALVPYEQPKASPPQKSESLKLGSRFLPAQDLLQNSCKKKQWWGWWAWSCNFDCFVFKLAEKRKTKRGRRFPKVPQKNFCGVHKGWQPFACWTFGWKVAYPHQGACLLNVFFWQSLKGNMYVYKWCLHGQAQDSSCIRFVAAGEEKEAKKKKWKKKKRQRGQVYSNFHQKVFGRFWESTKTNKAGLFSVHPCHCEDPGQTESEAKAKKESWKESWKARGVESWRHSWSKEVLGLQVLQHHSHWTNVFGGYFTSDKIALNPDFCMLRKSTFRHRATSTAYHSARERAEKLGHTPETCKAMGRSAAAEVRNPNRCWLAFRRLKKEFL